MPAPKSAPVPAPEAEVAPAPPAQEAPAEAPAPRQRFFKGVHGITDGMVHHVKDAFFVGTESILAHFERTGGRDGNRVLYTEVSKADYERSEAERSAAIQDAELPELPLPAAVPQVTSNFFSELPLPAPGEAPVSAAPGGAGLTQPGADNGLAGSTGSA